MKPIRSLLVHVDGTPRCAARLKIARSLATDLGASLTGLFAASPPLTDLPYGYAGGAIPLQALQDMRAKWRSDAKAAFNSAFKGSEAKAAWAELDDDPVIYGFAQQALYADLLVLGQHDPNDPLAQELPSDFVQSVLIDSGRPALVVPYAGDIATVGRKVLIAWKASRESARAVSAALPLLQRAEQVHVVSWPEDEPAAVRGKTLNLQRFLQLHGVESTLHQPGQPPREVGELLLSQAADLDADLMVMGCYGHSRLRQFVLGGVTRTVLRAMTVPVLMSH